MVSLKGKLSPIAVGNVAAREKKKIKFVSSSSNVREGVVVRSPLKDMTVIKCLDIRCHCELGILMNQEVESHLNVKIPLHPQ